MYKILNRADVFIIQDIRQLFDPLHNLYLVNWNNLQ